MYLINYTLFNSRCYIVFQIVNSCNTTVKPSPQPDKRSLSEQRVIEYKRTTSTPDVSLNSSLFDELENKFMLLDGDVISNG